MYVRLSCYSKNSSDKLASFLSKSKARALPLSTVSPPPGLGSYFVDLKPLNAP